MKKLIIALLLIFATSVLYSADPTPTPPSSTVSLLTHDPTENSMIISDDSPDVELHNIKIEDALVWWDHDYWSASPDPSTDHEALVRFAFPMDDSTLTSLDIGLVTRDDNAYFIIGRPIDWKSADWSSIPEYTDHMEIFDHTETPTEPSTWQGAWFFGGKSFTMWSGFESPYYSRVNINAFGGDTSTSITGMLVENSGSAGAGYYRRGIHIKSNNMDTNGTAISVDSEIQNAKYGYAVYAHGNSSASEALVGVYSEAQGSGTNYAVVCDGGYIVIADIGGISTFTPETWLGLNTDHLFGKTGMYVETMLEVDGNAYFEECKHLSLPQHDGSGSSNNDIWFDTDSGTLRYKTGGIEYVIPLYTPTP